MKQTFSGNCLRKQGGVLHTEGEGVKNRQNPVYVVCVRPLKRFGSILIPTLDNLVAVSFLVSFFQQPL